MAASLSQNGSATHMEKYEESKITAGQETVRHTDESNLPLRKAIRRCSKVAGYAYFVTLANLLWGYDLVIVDTVSSILAFQMVFGEAYEDRYIIPSSWFAIWRSPRKPGFGRNVVEAVSQRSILRPPHLASALRYVKSCGSKRR